MRLEYVFEVYTSSWSQLLYNTIEKVYVIPQGIEENLHIDLL